MDEEIAFYCRNFCLNKFKLLSFFKNNNISDYFYLNNENNILIKKINILESKNNILKSEIRELSSSSHSLENFARYNLGLVKNDETFVHVIIK